MMANSNDDETTLLINSKKETTVVRRELSVDNISVVVADHSAKRRSPLAALRSLFRADSLDSPNKKTILKNVSLHARSGELLFMLGASGAGKTTLLNVLSGREKPTRGHVLVNHQRVDERRMKHVLNYVPQDDVVWTVLTPRELLTYADALLVASGDGGVGRRSRTDALLDQLGLLACADTVIGDEGERLLSGGQRKRVSIAMGMVQRPSILLVDEPTSGLDSTTALDVCVLLKQIAARGRTVVCTIHQPSFELLQICDRMALMDDGHLVFHGTVGAAIASFEAAGHAIPPRTNPSDHFMNVLVQARRNGEPIERIDNVGCKVSDDGQAAAGEHDDDDDDDDDDDIGDDDDDRLTFSSSFYHTRQSSLSSIAPSMAAAQQQQDVPATYVTNFFVQTWVLVRRQCWLMVKDVRQAPSRVALSIGIALFLGLCYLQLSDAQSSLLNRLSVLFISILFLSLNSLLHTLTSFIAEKIIVQREVSDGWYSSPAYSTAKIVVICLFQALYGVLFGCTFYFLVGLRIAATPVLSFLATVTMAGWISVVLGLFVGTLLPSVELATAFVGPVLAPLVIFSGFLVSGPSVPVYFVWLPAISYFKYAFEIMTVTQFEHFNFAPCHSGNLTVAPAPGKNCTLHDLSGCTVQRDGQSCPLGSVALYPDGAPGTLVLEQLGFSDSNIWPDAACILLAIYAIVVVACYIIIHVRSNRMSFRSFFCRCR
jgi:ABC-type multidrug transport system ATPase subunit